MAFGDYSIDPLSDYESPMYGPIPEYGAPDYTDPAAAYAGGSANPHEGYTPMGALLFGDNVYNIAVSIMQWIRLTRPIE
jgi:hypothetical protein